MPATRVAGALARARGRGAARPRRVPARRRPAASGATSTCCASSAGARSPRCAARSSRSSRTRSPGSSRRGTTSPASGVGWRRWSRRSASSRARRSSPARSRPTCCRCACAATARPILDELCTAGELVWVGAGSIGASDGRVRLTSPISCRCSRRRSSRPTARRRAARRDPPAARASGAPASGARSAPRHPATNDAEMLAALWDLVWAGEVTNDTLGAAARGADAARGPDHAVAAAVAKTGSGSGRGPGRLTRIGPPAGAGRWSLVAPLLEPIPTATAAAHAIRAADARALRRRHPRGRARRGRGRRVLVGVRRAEGARGARPGAPRLLRHRARRRAVQPARRRRPSAQRPRGARRPTCTPRRVPRAGRARRHRPGAAVRRRARPGPSRPGRPARSAGALVVLHNGFPLVWFDRRSHHLVTFPGARDDRRVGRGAGDARQGRRARSVEVRKVNGEPLPTSPVNAEITAAAKRPASSTATAACSTRRVRWRRTAGRAAVLVASVSRPWSDLLPAGTAPGDVRSAAR